MTQLEIEHFVEQYIYPILETGDAKWDKPHSQATGFHMQKILESLKDEMELNRSVLVLAAYCHDVGYSKHYLQGRSLTKEEYMEAKKSHAVEGVAILKPLLMNIALSPKERNDLLHLVLVHDAVKSHTTIEEKLLMEADTLAGLDTDFVTPTFTKAKYLSLLEKIKTERRGRFITDYSKGLFDTLVSKRLLFYGIGVEVQ